MMFSKIAVLLMLVVCTVFSATPKLDIDFTQNKTEYAINGDGIEQVAGEKLMLVGNKTACTIPVQKMLDTQGTVLLQFALKNFAPYKGSPRRPMLTIDAANALQLAISTGANINPPFVQFTLADGKNNFYFVKNNIEFNKFYTAVLSFDGNYVRCYLNGVLIHEEKQPDCVKTGLWRNLFIGPYKNGWTSVGPWNGDTLVKKAMVFDTVLTSAEIAELSGLKVESIATRYPQSITVPMADVKPDADGLLNDDAWKNAASFYGMVDLAAPEKSWDVPQNSLKYLYDNDNLYIRFYSRIPAGTNIKPGHETSEGEKEIWGSESFELYLTNGDDLYRFAGCYAGGKCEMKNKNDKYNGKWTFRSASKMNIDDTVSWTGDISIPWKSIGFDSAPAKGLTFNFGRTWRLNDRMILGACTAGMDGYADVKSFMKMNFAKTTPIASITTKNDPRYGILDQNITLQAATAHKVRFTILGESSQGTIQAMSLFDKTVELKSGIDEVLAVNAPLTQNEVDTLVFTMSSADGKTIYQQQALPVHIAPEYIFATPLFGQSKILVKFNKTPFAGKYGANAVPTLKLVSPDGKSLISRKLTDEQSSIEFSQDNKPGYYRLELQNDKGEVLSSTLVDFPGYGEWSKITCDKTRILPPFTPMSYENDANAKVVSMWGRKYAYPDNRLFPSRVTSQNANMLAAPIALQIDGNDIANNASVSYGLAAKHRFEYQAKTSGKTYQVNCNGWTEYDGVAFYHVDLTAIERLGKVELVFTLPRSEAKYLHAADSPWGTKITDFIKDGRRSLHYYPSVFMGTEERGITFFAESRYTWLTKDSNVLDITADGKYVRLTAKLADEVKSGQKLSFEFGMLASPVKPLPKRYPFSIMDGYSEMNRPGRRPTIDTTFVHWPSYQTHGDCLGDLPPENNPLKQHYIKEVARLRSYDCMPVFYAMNMCIPDEYREVAANLNEWCTMPHGAFPYTKNNKNNEVEFLCPTSVQAVDFYIWHLRQLLKDAKFSGIYFDFGGPQKCNNTLHGCHERTPILAMREFLRRVATEFIDSGQKEYIIQLHNTDNIQMASQTFATHLFNGEHIRQASSSLLHDGKDILDTYKLPMFACELNSLPWGIVNNAYSPADVLLPKYGGGKEKPELYVLRITRAMMAGTLVHGSIPAAGRSHHGIFDKVVRIYDAFNVQDATFLGYYNSRNPLEVIEGKDIYASVYRKNGKLLLVVSHLGNERLNQNVKIKIDANKLDGWLPKTALEKMDAPDPEYQELYSLRKERKLPDYRVPLEYAPAGNKITSYENGILTIDFKYHTFALIEMQ